MSRSDIQLSNGEFFDFLAPEQAKFSIYEIAHALSNICRFTGHCRRLYSVAQHSVLVSHIVPPEHAMAGLLHDAAVAFIGDVAKPLKELLPDYKVIEQRGERAVLARFGIGPELPPCIKHADLVALATEKRDLMPRKGYVWECTKGIEPLAQAIRPQTPFEAMSGFLWRYMQVAEGV